MAIFEGLRLVDVLGHPTIGEVSRPWVLEYAATLFGSLDPETGRRAIRDFGLLIAKKNGKSTLAAAIMLTLLLRNWRDEAEALIVAPTIEVANNSFGPAAAMVREDPELRDLLHVQHHVRTITHRVTRAALKVVAAEAETVSGKKASWVLVDELWQFGLRGDAENMLREATGGLASRPEGCVIYLSTQSDKAPAGIFAQKLAEYRDVRDGKIADPKTLPVIFEFPPEMVEDGSYREPANWYIPNPSLGGSVDRTWLEDQAAKAERAGEASWIGFAAKHLNVEIGVALRADGWAGAPYWAAGVDPELTFKSILERSEVVAVGIDGGGLDDLLGIYVIGREIKTGRWLGWGHAFVSPQGEERRKGNAAVYENFKADGDLELVALPEDIAGIVGIVLRVKDAGLLDMVGVDTVGLGAITQALGDIGVTEGDKLLIGVRQGIGLMGATKTVERKLVDGTFRHSGGRMMAWCVGNLKIVPTPTAMRLARDESGLGKIDPAAAMFDAAQLMARNPESKRSVYETRGILHI